MQALAPPRKEVVANSPQPQISFLSFGRYPVSPNNGTIHRNLGPVRLHASMQPCKHQISFWHRRYGGGLWALMRVGMHPCLMSPQRGDLLDGHHSKVNFVDEVRQLRRGLESTVAAWAVNKAQKRPETRHLESQNCRRHFTNRLPKQRNGFTENRARWQ